MLNLRKWRNGTGFTSPTFNLLYLVIFYKVQFFICVIIALFGLNTFLSFQPFYFPLRLLIVLISLVYALLGFADLALSTNYEVSHSTNVKTKGECKGVFLPSHVFPKRLPITLVYSVYVFAAL